MSADELVIRRATIGDVRAMAVVQVAAWQSAYAGVLNAPSLNALTVDVMSNCWRAALRSDDPSVTHLIARQSGRTIGIASLGAPREDSSNPGWGELRVMQIHPEARGTGAGSALHDHCLLTLTARGYRAAFWWLVIVNARERGFYASRGWREDGQRRRDTRVQPNLDEVRLAHPLVGVPGRPRQQATT